MSNSVNVFQLIGVAILS